MFGLASGWSHLCPAVAADHFNGVFPAGFIDIDKNDLMGNLSFLIPISDQADPQPNQRDRQ